MRRIITFIIFIILITFTLAGNARAENTSSGNLALNKSYTKSEEPRADYPDTGHESTDGILAGEYNDGKSYGYNIPVGTSKTIDIIIDLAELKTVGSVKVHKWEGYYQHGPDAITISVSFDGTNYRPVGGISVLSGSWFIFNFSTASARYVKASFSKYNNGSLGSDCLFIDEVEVYTESIAIITPYISSLAKIPTASTNVGAFHVMPEKITANMSDGSIDEVDVKWIPGKIDTSAPGLKTATGIVTGYNGTAQLNVQVNEVNTKNLAQNKSYTKSEEPYVDYSDSGKESTDGIMAGDCEDEYSYGYYIKRGDSKSIYVTIDLGEEKDIDTVKVHKWEGEYPYGPESISVSTSENGSFYKAGGTVLTPKGAWYIVHLENTRARYVKVKFFKRNSGKSGSYWLFIDEIAVYGDKKL